MLGMKYERLGETVCRSQRRQPTALNRCLGQADGGSCRLLGAPARRAPGFPPAARCSEAFLLPAADAQQLLYYRKVSEEMPVMRSMTRGPASLQVRPGRSVATEGGAMLAADKPRLSRMADFSITTPGPQAAVLRRRMNASARLRQGPDRRRRGLSLGADALGAGGFCLARAAPAVR